MFKALLKKQLFEAFRGFFYDAKKGQKRDVKGIVGRCLLFVLIFAGVMGGMIALAVMLCSNLVPVGLGWLYFIIMIGLAIVAGVLGGVFNAYASLYLSKDNDLLLSMPIPIKNIIAARLSNVYLLGAAFSMLVSVPTAIVYMVIAGASPLIILCDILLILIVTIVVLILACLLGWCVAKISQRIKNKSAVATIAILLVIVLYYFGYARVNALIRDLVANAVMYGETLEGPAYGPLYYFGRIGEGDVLAALAFLVIVGALFYGVWLILKKTFLKLTITSGKTKEVKYDEKKIEQKSQFSALLRKEFKKFTSSATYMTNCGLGVILIPICGIVLLVKGGEMVMGMSGILGDATDGVMAVVICTVFCMLCAMDNVIAPSISLEGKNLWILQSLPVNPKKILNAKIAMHLIVAGLPVVFALICGLIILPISIWMKAMIAAMVLIYLVFSTLMALVFGLKMPILTWTNEVVPIKQSGAVGLSIFGGWIIVGIFAALYFTIGKQIGALLYLAIWLVIFVALTILLWRWIRNKGAKIFAKL